jgi:methionyl-tRNA synthetase
MLMALDLPLPKQVFGHPWLIQSDGKMSKSKGNVMYADDMVRLFGVDAVRFFVLHEMPFENDGVISWELVVERINSELANTLGNLVNRTISMSNKYFDGVVTNTKVEEEVDNDLKKVVMDCRYKVAECMDKLKVADAISEIFTLFKRCNKYIDETMPWALAKDESKTDRLNTVLYNLVESIVIGATLLEPYMPETSEKILAQLNAEKRKVTELGRFGLYPSGNKVTDKPEILFARLDVKEVMAEVEKFAPKEEETIYEKAKKQKAENENSEEHKKQKIAEEKVASLKKDPSVLNKEEITLEEFQKMQLMIGEIIACEEVHNSRKLLCSQVKFGENNVKQIVSGIKGFYSPEEMVGKKVVAIVNLKPCKLAGVLSEGMLLCAEDTEGNLSLLTTEKGLPGGCFIS